MQDNLFDLTRSIAFDGPRVANDDEIFAYAHWLRRSRGLPNFPGVTLRWHGGGRRVHAICIAVSFGGDAEAGAYSLLLPGYNSHRQRVTMETLDEAGGMIASQTLPVEPKKGGVIWDRAAVRKASGPVPKLAKGAAFAPIADAAPAAPIYAKPERVRTVSQIVGNLQYGSLRNDHFVIGQAGAFEATDCTDLARWHWHREGRSTAYGEGFATREEALAALDDYLASEAAEPAQWQEQPLAPATPAPEAVNALSEAPEPEIEAIEPLSPAQELPEEAELDLAEAMRAMMARLDAIEATLSAGKGAIEGQAPAVRPARSPAHERAIRRAWKERLMRRAAVKGNEFHRNLMRDQLENADLRARRWKELAEAETRRANRAERKRRRAVLLARRHWKMRLVARYQYKAAERAADHERAMRHRSTGTGRALALQARHERDRAKIAAGAARAEIAKLKRDMVDPAQPERASDIARLVSERDTARNALAAVQARADRQKEALDSMADNFEAMALRVAKAEAAMRRAGLIAAA